MPGLIRGGTCATCHHRAPDIKGTQRCHAGPPQRALIVMPAPNGQLSLTETSAFAPVADDDWCALHKPKIHLVPTGS